jgi:hypothetical protein
MAFATYLLKLRLAPMKNYKKHGHGITRFRSTLRVRRESSDFSVGSHSFTRSTRVLAYLADIQDLIKEFLDK